MLIGVGLNCKSRTAKPDIRMFTVDPDASQPKLITVDLNRPFIYGIVEKSTGLPLFIGSKSKI